MKRRTMQILSGCAGVIALAAAAFGQSQPFGPTEPHLVVGHDGPEPAIYWRNLVQSSPSWVKLLGTQDGLTGVWGLTTGGGLLGLGGLLYWTHGDGAGNSRLFAWDGSSIVDVEIVDAKSGDGLEISGLAYINGVLYGTGPDDGWTRFDDSGVVKIYVSESLGSNGNTGQSPSHPVKDIAVGIFRLEEYPANGTAAQLLLKRGDDWELDDWIDWTLVGASADRPMVIGSYGTGARPKLIFKHDPNNLYSPAFRMHQPSTTPKSFVALTDLHLTVERDFEPGAALWEPEGLLIQGTWTHVLVENCLIEGFAKNIIVQRVDDYRPKDIAIRRTVVVDGYTYRAGTHAMGLFGGGVDRMLIEDCIFDMNGWSPDRLMFAGDAPHGGPNTITVAAAGAGWVEMTGSPPAHGFLEGSAITVTTPATPEPLVFDSVIKTYAASVGRAADPGCSGCNALDADQMAFRGETAPHDDFYVGAVIQLATEPQPRTITGYELRNSSPDFRRVVTVHAAWTNGIPANGTEYTLTGDQIEVAFVEDSPGTFTFDPSTTFEVTGAKASIFRHNTYIDEYSTDVVMRGTISARSSANGLHVRPGGLMDANLSLENPLGIVVGNTLSHATGVVRNNAAIRGMDIWHPSNPDPRGFGMFPGPVDTLDVYGNLFAHHGGQSTSSFNHMGIHFPRSVADMWLFENRIFNWFNASPAGGVALSFDPNQTQSGVKVFRNHLQQPSGGTVINAVGSQLFCNNPDVTFTDNLYWLTGASAITQLETWLGPPTGGCTGEGTAQRQEVAYTDPWRDIATYIGLSFGNNTAVGTFMAAARQQEKGNWARELTAGGVLNDLRSGFDMPPLPAYSRRILYEIDPDTGYASIAEAWAHFDFGGIEADPDTGDLYGISTRKHGLDSKTALYLLDPVSGPTEIGQDGVDAREMEGVAVLSGVIYIVSGEDKAVLLYDADTGDLLGTIATPIDYAHLGGTYGGAAILWSPLP